MTIVDDLTPVYYRPVRIVIEIKPDGTLTAESLSYYTDVRILNINGQQLGTDHPKPQTTSQQDTAFLSWLLNNLSTYESLIGLTRFIEENNE